MFNYKSTLQAMRKARASMQAELDKLDQAIAALHGLVGNVLPTRTITTLSAQARRRISQAGKKTVVKAKKAKRKISAQGLRNIIAAQNRRWAKVRAAAKTKAKAAGKKA